jgi:hypothetical protein
MLPGFSFYLPVPFGLSCQPLFHPSRVYTQVIIDKRQEKINIRDLEEELFTWWTQGWVLFCTGG